MNKTETDPRRLASKGLAPIAKSRLPIQAPKLPDADPPLKR